MRFVGTLYCQFWVLDREWYGTMRIPHPYKQKTSLYAQALKQEMQDVDPDVLDSVLAEAGIERRALALAVGPPEEPVHEPIEPNPSPAIVNYLASDMEPAEDARSLGGGDDGHESQEEPLPGGGGGNDGHEVQDEPMSPGGGEKVGCNDGYGSPDGPSDDPYLETLPDNDESLGSTLRGLLEHVGDNDQNHPSHAGLSEPAGGNAPC